MIVCWIATLYCIWKFIDRLFQRNVKIAIEFIRNIFGFRRDVFEAYVNKLEEYCTRLCDNGCVTGFDVLCLDLKKVKELVYKLKVIGRNV